MFCGYCGRQIPDDASFCGYCGKPRDPAAAQPPRPQPVVPLDRAQRKAAQEKIFTREWNAFVRSPLVLITLLICSAYWVLSLFSDITEVPGLINELSFYMNEVLVVIFTVLVFASPVLEALLLLGLWRVYGNAVSKPNDRPASDGLRLSRTAMIASTVVGVVVIFLVFMAAFGELDISGRTGSVLVVTLLITGVLVGLIYWAIFSILGKIIRNVDYCETEYGMLSGFGVVSIVLGGVSALGLMAEFSLGAVLSATSMIMIGCVLLSCKSTLRRIEWQYYRLRSNKNVPSASGYNSYRGY